MSQLRDAVRSLIENFLATSERKAAEASKHHNRDRGNEVADKNAFRRQALYDGAEHLGRAVISRMENFK